VVVVVVPAVVATVGGWAADAEGFVVLPASVDSGWQ
jgi:hypothetical protein